MSYLRKPDTEKTFLLEGEDRKTVTFDDALRGLGDFGPYQRRVFFLMCLMASTAGIQTIMTVFTLATQDHRCAIPELPNDTYQDTDPYLLNLSIPWEEDDDGSPVRSQCLLYRNRNQSSPPDELLPNRSTESCDKWVFDHSTFTSTFSEEADLVCEKDTFHATADMLYMVGVLTGSLVAGVFSDRFGRKFTLMVALVLHSGFCIGEAFAQSYAVFAAIRFFIGLSNLAVFLSAYVLGLELVGSSYRTIAGSVIQMFWPIGLFIQTGVAYGLRDWRHLQLALSCPTVLFLSYYWFVKESPRWLASRGRYDEANAILRQVAKVNKKPAPPAITPSKGQESVKGENALAMFTNRVTFFRTVIVFINWVVVTMVYYGISLNVGSIGPNIYLNSFLSAFAELVGYIVGLIGLDRLGRKKMHCGSMILSGLACLSTMFPVIFSDGGEPWVLLVLSNIGKLGASAAFSIIYLFSAELFPTVARNSLMGASSMIARLGGIASPYIGQLNVLVGGNLGVALPLVVFGGSALAAGLLALLLPETLHKPLPETIEDARNFGKNAKVAGDLLSSSKTKYYVNSGFSGDAGPSK